MGQKVVEDEDKVTEKEQALDRSGVGTLFYLTKHSRPDIANAVRELPKSMDGVSKLQLRELKRVAKFVFNTKDLGLCIVPTMSDGIWHLEALNDSDFANDKETRIRVYAYIVFFCGVPVAWKSKCTKSVVLSTTEAEYVAVSEVVKEIKFLYQLLKPMEIKLPLPIKITVDNRNLVSKQQWTFQRTKHIDIRAHFVRSSIMDEVVTIDLVKSAENISDIMTKNE